MSRTSIRAAGLAAALCVLAAAGSSAGPDPQTVMGAEACKECHQAEFAAWQKTHHAQSLELLREGKEIATKLGVDRTYRREGLCLQCHTTVKADAAGAQPVSGVSCESCHGGARDWIKVHNDFGGPEATKAQESAEHRAERWKKAEAAGMIRPSRIDAVAANCFGCHTVPEQALVNAGGHHAGSDFDLVAWSQGEVRHNYLASKGQANAETTPARRRVLYVTGKALDLEHALRGVAKVTEKGEYSRAMVARAKAACAALDAIQAKAPTPELGELLPKLPRDEAGALKPSITGAVALADQVAAATRKFVAAQDGSALAGVDALIPPAAAWKGTASP